MGMFDSFTAPNGSDWQSKAMDCYLDRYRVGDPIGDAGAKGDFQMEVIGDGEEPGEFLMAFVKIRGGIVAEVGVPRDESLPAIAYMGGPFTGVWTGWISSGAAQA